MAADEHFSVLSDPFLYLLSFLCLLYRFLAGPSILEPHDMHESPEVPHQDQGYNPELVIQKIAA
jgi:hypothetical protein